MSFINKIFGITKDNKEEKVLPWIPLTSLDQLKTIVDKSKVKTQVIFKHSTRCGISRMVKRQFEKQYNLDGEADLYYLNILKYRDISNDIAKRFGVYHESPQLLIINNGVVVKHDSHGSINDLDIEKFV
jgi:bacillithiol system protein YtxJ